MRNGPYIEVSASTWNRETHGLYDYEARSIQKRVFKVNDTCSIYRFKEECYIPSSEIVLESFPLVSIEKIASEYQINLLSNDPTNKMWLVVKGIKTSKNKGYKLNEGDWLKLGRVRLRVQKIVLSPSNTSQHPFPEFFRDHHREDINDLPESEKDEKENEENEENRNSPCRICLNEVSTPADPLITPCRCAGTMRFIHLNCLKEWLKTKVASRLSEKGMSYYLKDLTCELCKCNLPAFITHEGQKVNLLTISFPLKSYIVLEEFRPERNVKQGLHFISLNDNESGSVGRGHDCDIKISDISVSRSHCKVVFVNSEFFLQDSRSKFGTLAKLKRSFMFRDGYDVTVQVSRTVLRFVHKVPWTCKNFCSCFGSSKVANANLSYLTQPEYQFSDSEVLSNLPSSRHLPNEES